ncbi:hypothetical protein [Halorubrum distributum]|uniref:hypothetical protein n=1 Tax=Halorubrum distributum TaxID=29283 RepID=UPI000AA34DC3|nr:hypothetical protein [Halorubrum distributum]
MDPSKVDENLDVEQIPWEHDDVTSYIDDLTGGKQPEDILDEQIELIEDLDGEAALERLVIADIANSIISSADVPDDGAGLPPALHKYLIVLILAHSSTSGKRDVNYTDLAGPILDLSLKYLHDTDINAESPPDEKLKSRVEHSLKEQVFLAGKWKFSKQPIEASKRAYSPHNEQLKKELGFTIEEALRCADYIEEKTIERREEIIDDEFSQLVQRMAQSGHTIDVLNQQYDEKGDIDNTSGGEDFKSDSKFLDQLYTKYCDSGGSFFVDYDNMISDRPGDIKKDVLQDFVDRMSDNLGDVDSNRNFRWPYQFNPLSETPIVQVEDRLLVPSGDALRSALESTFYYDLISLEDYGSSDGTHGGEFGRIFGDYVEDWAYDCLMKLYPEEDVYKNPLRPGSYEEACDILVEGRDTLYVIECKTGKIPIHLRNSDFDAIQEELNSKVGEGYTDQALPLVQELRDGTIDELVYDGKLVEISDYNKYQPIILIGESYDSVATYLIDVIVNSESVPPYVIDIYCFQVITEFFESRARFESYIRKRLRLFNDKSIISGDEIDYLGLYYLNDYSFPEMEKNNFVIMEDMGREIAEEIGYKFGH